MNVVAVDPKWKEKKKKPTTLSFNYILQFKLGNKNTKKGKEIKNGDSRPHATVTWPGVTSLEPEQASVSRLKALGAGGAGSRKCAPYNGPRGPLAICMSTQSPDPGGPTCREIMPTSPPKWWSLWAGKALHGPLGTVCPLFPNSSLCP